MFRNVLKKKQKGVTAIEYAVLAAALAGLLLTVASSGSPLFEAIEEKFDAIATQIKGSSEGGSGN